MVKLHKAGLACVLLLASLFIQHLAYACSGGNITPEGSFIRSNAVVVGQILSWHATGKKSDIGREVIRVSVQVSQQLKGNDLVRIVTFYDERSLDLSGEPFWGTDACGSFPFDPTGYYIVVGLSRGANHHFYSTSWSIYYLGNEPEDPELGYANVIANLKNIKLHQSYPYPR